MKAFLFRWFRHFALIIAGLSFGSGVAAMYVTASFTGVTLALGGIVLGWITYLGAKLDRDVESLREEAAALAAARAQMEDMLGGMAIRIQGHLAFALLAAQNPQTVRRFEEVTGHDFSHVRLLHPRLLRCMEQQEMDAHLHAWMSWIMGTYFAEESVIIQ